jgi:MFS family permease
MSHVVGFLSSHRRMYLSHFLGMSTVVMLAYGLYAWVPSMFIRTWGWSISQIGVAYGIVTLAAGPLAAMLSSWLGEHLTRRQHQDAHMRAVAWIVLMTVIGALLATVMPNPWLALVMLTPAAVGTTAATGSGLSALMTITPNQMRAQVSALYFLVVNLFGLTIGPTGVALFTDYVFHDESSLRYSILCMTAIGGVAAALLLSYNLRHYREAYVESQRWAGT